MKGRPNVKPELKKALLNAGRGLTDIFGIAAKVLGTIFLIIITTGSILAVMASIYVTRYLTVETEVNFNDYTLKESSIVYYTDEETGETYELETLYGEQNRIWADYNEIPGHMIDALVAIEDKRFFNHQGVDWKRTVGAFMDMFLGGGTYGGSTITQQLIKNTTLDKDDTVARKIQEIMRALEVEKTHSKEEILERYLNTCYFGQGCYGVKTAAETYFGKELSELTPAESASIIGITNRPTAYNPYLNPDRNKKRQEDILHEMFKQDKLTRAEYNRAIGQTLVFISKEYDYESPEHVRSYFVDQIVTDAAGDLIEEYGISRYVANSLIYSGGYRIYATIDTRIQNIIDEIYQDEENFPQVKDSEKPQSSMILMDPYTGSILGMAGGRGVKTGNLMFNHATHAQRQPGSAIKPVTVYGAAIDLGFITPYSVVDDMPSEDNGKNWPKNYNDAFRGRTNVLTAVQDSVNTIAVRIVEMITPQKSFDFAYDTMGLASLVAERWITQGGSEKKQTDIDRSPMALGGLTKGLTVRELTAAYCAFVNRGIYSKPRTYSFITDSRGETVIDNRPQTTVAMKEKTAYYMEVLLQQAVTAGTATRAKLDNMATAGKTGTTSEDKDRWFIGFTPYYACGSWFGFTMPKKITLSSSTNPALAMWKLVMDEVHKDLPSRSFPQPGGFIGASYCLDSGMSPTENCRLDPRGGRVSTGSFAPEDVPRMPCNVHTVVNVDKKSGQLATPYCPVEDLVRIGLLNLSRGVTEPVHVWDEQYVVRYWGDGIPYGPNIPDEFDDEGNVIKSRPIALGANGNLAYNTFCELHRTEPLPSPSPEPPPDTETPPETVPTAPPDNVPIPDVVPSPAAAVAQ